jgi:hypothetical protein
VGLGGVSLACVFIANHGCGLYYRAQKIYHFVSVLFCAAFSSFACYPSTKIFLLGGL